jgi:DNA-binding MarR family transcriptional regulator
VGAASEGGGVTSALPQPHDPTALRWLLRRSVRRYRAPISAALERAGLGDLTQQGVWAVGVLARPGASAGDLVAGMGISKQAVGQLVDTLVALGYVERRPYPEDRRRTLLALTTKGRKAARVIDHSVAAVEGRMRATLGGDRLDQLYGMLIELDSD